MAHSLDPVLDARTHAPLNKQHVEGMLEMRTAAFIAGAIIAVGAYLTIAAAFAFSPTWIGLGLLAIAVVGAIGIMSASSTQIRPPGATR